MRAAFLAQNSPESQFASNEMARAMANSTVNAFMALKRYVRFLCNTERVVWVWARQELPMFLDAFSDSNHAGCATTGRSISCSILMHGGHCIKTSATTQVPISLSTGESEYHGGRQTASTVFSYAVHITSSIVIIMTAKPCAG